MPPLEMEPQSTPPKDDVSYRHKPNSTPRRLRKADSPSDRTTPLIIENTDGSISEEGTGTPATAMSTPSSTVSSTPPSASSSTTSATPRNYLRNLFSGPLSTSISEGDVRLDISGASLSSASPRRLQMLFQDQSRDEKSGALHHRSPSTPPRLLEQAEDIPSTIISQDAFSKHTRSASLQAGDSSSLPFHTIQRQRRSSRLYDSLSLEGSFQSSCGLSERRRSCRGRSSPNASVDNSLSSEERFPSDTSLSPSRAGPTIAYTQSHRRNSSRSSLQEPELGGAGPMIAYTQSHRRNSSRSSLQEPELGGAGPMIAYTQSHRRNSSRSSLLQPELGGDRKNPTTSVWMKPLVRLAHTRGLIWILCLVALTSLSMTIITNRSMAGIDITVAPLQETTLISFGREHGKSVHPFLAGLRGNLIRSVGRSQRETTFDLHNFYGHQEKEPATKHADDSKHSHEGNHEHKEGKTEDVQKHKHHGDKSSKDDRPVSLKALSHHQDEKTNPAKDSKSLPKQHPHAKSYPDIHKTHQESKHSYDTSKRDVSVLKSVTRKVKRLIPAVVFPRMLLDSKPRFESQDRRLYRKPTHERKAGGAAKRVVFLDDSIAHRPPPRRKVSLYPADFTDNTQLYSVLDSDDERVKSMELREPYKQGDCVPMQDWQTTFHPSCNVVHEIGLADIGDANGDDAFLFGTKGYWRNAWKVDLLGGRNHLNKRDTIVLKTLKYVCVVCAQLSSLFLLR
jgi:hypothetical protein